MDTLDYVLEAIERRRYCRDAVALQNLLTDISPKLRLIQIQLADLNGECEFLRKEVIRTVPYLVDDFD